MKPHPRPNVDRARKLVAISLAALMTATSASGQTDSETIRRLQEENAALKRRLAEVERNTTTTTTTATPAPGTAPAATTGPAPRTTTGPSLTTDEGVLTLSAFEVKTEKDYGYLKTNAATATRIGMEIQHVPMNISVMSEDFIRDTGIESITDVMRFTSSGSPDSRFAMRRPANEATPQGNFTMRGFTINALMRNSVFRYTSYNLDNVERVEIVKGPAAVFFGQGYPGGVINYITKKPSLSKIPSTFEYSVDNNRGDRVRVDHNVVLNDRAAFRVVGAWSDLTGDQAFEFRKNFNITPSLTVLPFANGKVKLNLELEHLRESFNESDFAWIMPDQWFADYANPPASLIAVAPVAVRNAANPAEAYRARIFNSLGNWNNDRRAAAGDPTLPLYTRAPRRGAYYTNASGQRIYDESFNWSNRGNRVMNELTTVQATLDASPFEWLDARYTFTKEDADFDNYEALLYPNADGRTFNAINGGNTSGYYRNSDHHQLDLVFKVEAFGVKNKFLTGGVYNKYVQQYNGNAANTTPLYWQVPGYNYGGPGQPQIPGGLHEGWNVPSNQVILDRAGNVMTPAQVYTQYDPGIHVQPTSDKVFPLDRNLLDGYKPDLEAWYVNWQAQLLDDRLTLLAGYRKETSKATGQHLVANFPWFIPPPNATFNQGQFPPNVYNYSPSYAGDPENFETNSGDSWMAGLSYDITKDISVYATFSKTFKLNSGIAGGYDRLNIDNLIQSALNHGGGSFNYLGQNVTSIAQFKQIMASRGADAELDNEEGSNIEVGVKTALWDSKVVSTFSLFRGERKNQKLDDSNAQANAQEPFNSSTTLFAPGTLGYNTRNFRWRSLGVVNEIEGAEFDIVWSPIRNYQAVINGAWLWKAETTDDPRYARGTAFANMYFGSRIENVPEYRLNLVNRYTFTETMVRGLSLGLNMRYSSETVISRSFDFNPQRGGLMAGDFVVFDANISYPWKVFGYQFSTALRVFNIADKEYLEGNYVPSEGRNWILSTTLTF